MTKMNPFLSTKNQNRLAEFMHELIDDDEGGIMLRSSQLASLAVQSEKFLSEFLFEHFEELWKRIILHPQTAIAMFPFFQIGLSSIRSCFASDMIGHMS